MNATITRAFAWIITTHHPLLPDHDRDPPAFYAALPASGMTMPGFPADTMGLHFEDRLTGRKLNRLVAECCWD